LMLKCIGDLSLQYTEREHSALWGFLLVRRCVWG
jgi:hypothetical protein